MTTKPLAWVQGPWSVQLHTAHEATYDRLDLTDCTYPNWIISYVKEGSVITGMGGERHQVRAGEVMVHPPHLPFSEHSDRGGLHLWFQATIQCAQHVDLLQLYRVSPVVAVPDPFRYEAAFRSLLAAWNDKGDRFRELKLASGALQLMEQLLAGWEKAGGPERPEKYDSPGDRFGRLIAHMAAKLPEKLSRDDLAAIVRLNANYLDRVFMRQYGLTPMQMLRDMRLQRAKQLLERTDDTIEAIAAQCGMTDASYLCKQYRKRYGMLPGEYRDSAARARADGLYG